MRFARTYARPFFFFFFLATPPSKTKIYSPKFIKCSTESLTRIYARININNAVRLSKCYLLMHSSKSRGAHSGIPKVLLTLFFVMRQKIISGHPLRSIFHHLSAIMFAIVLHLFPDRKDYPHNCNHGIHRNHRVPNDRMSIAGPNDQDNRCMNHVTRFHWSIIGVGIVGIF